MPRSIKSTDISSEFDENGATPMASSPDLSSSAAKKAKLSRMKRRHLTVLVLLVIAILGIAGTVYFYNQYETLKKNPNAEQQAEVTALVKEVGQYMLLPNEVPTVATVEDVTALKDQPFFTNAKNGDKVMVFVNARQAILYRPSTHMIINVAPLYFQNSQASAQDQSAVQPVVTKSSKSTSDSSSSSSDSSSN